MQVSVFYVSEGCFESTNGGGRAFVNMPKADCGGFYEETLKYEIKEPDAKSRLIGKDPDAGKD